MRRLEKLFQLDSKTIVLDLSAPQSGAEPQVLCGEEQPTGARRFDYWEPPDKTRTHSTVQELKRGRTSMAPVVHLQLSDKTLLLTADNLSETSSLSMVFFCMAKRSKELVRKSCDSSLVYFLICPERLDQLFQLGSRRVSFLINSEVRGALIARRWLCCERTAYCAKRLAY